jgi:hypothetical protein
MPNKKTEKPATAGLKPLPKVRGPGFDPASLKGAKPATPKLVLKRGLVPGKGGHR